MSRRKKVVQPVFPLKSSVCFIHKTHTHTLKINHAKQKQKQSRGEMITKTSKRIFFVLLYSKKEKKETHTLQAGFENYEKKIGLF